METLNLGCGFLLYLHNPSATIFVSNLSYSTTQAALQEAFSDIAPVKTCFIVHEKSAHGDDPTSASSAAKGPSKGVGYVTFAIREDAEGVVERFGAEKGEEMKIDGRAVRVKWADRKPTKGAPAESKPPTSKPKPERRKSTASTAPPKINDPDAIRTLLISNLPSEGLTNGALWKKIRKYDGAQKVVWPVEEDASIAHAIFDTPAHAAAAQSRLHAHVYKGVTLSVVLKKRSDSLFKAKKSMPSGADSNAGSATKLKPSRAGRVIVRNIPWGVTEDDLRAVFTPYGPIHSVTIPTMPSLSTTSQQAPRQRGFAFVWFLSQPDASRAITGANESGQNANASGARTIAVDWALSKEKWKEAVEKMEVDGEEQEEQNVDAAAVDDEDDWTDEEGASSSEGAGSDDGEDANSDESMDVDEDEEAHPPQPEEGSTLFVRNVPFEATDDDLKTLFRAFGTVRYARITMDADTGRSRGTGFVSFWDVDDAKTCIEEAERMRSDMDPEINAKKNPFTLLTVDPSSSRAARLVLHGRTLDVTVAVSRDRAEKLRETGERAREKQDTRNLYLMREGVIFPSSPAASSLTQAELQRRQDSFQARRTLLRTNPSLFISKTRLSVRNLPLWVSERGLKRLAVHAVRAFEEEVKAGTRAGLSEDELEDLGAEPAEREDDKPGKTKGKKKFTGRSTGVKQTKIIRVADRVDQLTGKGRSKGYGFIEMTTHADALRVLRWANNNREAHRMLWTLWRDEELPDLARSAKEQLDGLQSGKLNSRVSELSSGGGGEGSVKDGRTLHIEFSVENVTVIKRRRDKETSIRERDASGDKPSAKDKGKARSKVRVGCFVPGQPVL
ncbi:hypothetical protein DL93DRAFT_2055213 [Clavulina sp. PMI_390]|nr:hypothetical protein DL93DRAFT_2055213 [Clavulina sp. PMI_390]